MFKTGLVSITFRNLSTEEIIDIVSQAGLDGIEWGGDVHVPHGDIETAKSVGSKTRQAGVNVASYGSYYRLNATTEFTFDDVVCSAEALQTDLIRVWAGNKASQDADSSFWDGVAEDARKCAEKAQNAGMKLALEWHTKTLTDTAEAAEKFFQLTSHENLFTYWQPRNKTAPEVCLADMDAALERLIGLHVFNWDQETNEKLPLAEAKDTWKMYLEKAQNSPVQRDIYAMLEFVKDGTVDQFFEDAEVLKDIARGPYAG